MSANQGTAYDEMVHHAETSGKLLYAHLNRAGYCYALTRSATPPGREEYIEGAMIETTVFGPRVDGIDPVLYRGRLTREEAEIAVDMGPHRAGTWRIVEAAA